MMSHGKQLEIQSQQGTLAPDTLIQNIIKFETLTHQMRELQKKYFQTRDKNILSQSKAKEREVDFMLHEMGYDEQQTLF